MTRCNDTIPDRRCVLEFGHEGPHAHTDKLWAYDINEKVCISTHPKNTKRYKEPLPEDILRK